MLENVSPIQATSVESTSALPKKRPCNPGIQTQIGSKVLKENTSQNEAKRKVY